MFLHLIQLLLANLCVPIPRGASIQRMIQPIDSSPPKKKKKNRSIIEAISPLPDLSTPKSGECLRKAAGSATHRVASTIGVICLGNYGPLSHWLIYFVTRDNATLSPVPQLRSANFVYPHRSIECCIRKPEPPARTTSFPFFLTRLHHERCFSRGRFERRREEDPSIDRSIRSENGKTKLYLQKEEGDLRWISRLIGNLTRSTINLPRGVTISIISRRDPIDKSYRKALSTDLPSR